MFFSLSLPPNSLSSPPSLSLSSLPKTPPTPLTAHVLKLHFPNAQISSLLFLMDQTILSPPSSAAEFSSVQSQQAPDKIDVEAILISIDDFLNRNPFFVATLAFIWLVVIPVVEYSFKKYKYISAIDAFRKLKSEPSAQLLDIRNRKSLASLRSPNLKILNKSTVEVEFLEGDEDRFVKEVLMNFTDPKCTVLCVLDNFDGNALKVAELLFKNGFKEAYAIKGGLRGKNGWQEIQETLLPPSVHVYPRKKGKRKTSEKLVVNNKTMDENINNRATPAGTQTDGEKASNNGYIKPMVTDPQAKLGFEKPLSPYPNVSHRIYVLHIVLRCMYPLGIVAQVWSDTQMARA